MKRILFIFLAFMVLLFCGCKQDDRMGLYLTAAYSFPGPNVDQSAIQKKWIVKNIETDAYGRKLCTVWIPQLWFYCFDDGGLKKPSFMPGKVKVIMQQRNETEIYYYEDACFLFESENGFSAERIEQLKSQNDWNQPLQIEKCSTNLSCELYAGMDHIIWNGASITCIKEQFEDVLVNWFRVKEDKNGKELYGVYTYDEAQDSFASYFVIVDPQYGIDSNHGVMELTSLDFGEELHNFKIQNDWAFACPDCQDDGCQD